jgi:hypothetical protein
MESIDNCCRHKGKNDVVRDKERRKKNIFPYYLLIFMEETWIYQSDV